ncbi:DUF5715 family protein [Algoriphagus machipongonensis]|uniref:Peptidase M15B domain-containing protein n=1 Tax=Algoriphagus machipongonensis TaxID=388413 RepID=A3I115_9BACT|nr:DUF5715 family protein [Algoriphagus machipongonensis]EAZ80161.1 hypothetical protein ALPR1_16069 [Algoriphagus machipongonensis]
MKKPPFIQIASFFLLFSAGALATQAYMPELKKQLKDTYTTISNTVIPEKKKTEIPEAIEVELPELRVVPPIPKEVTKEYDKHLYAAEHNGFGLIENEEHFNKLIDEEKLVLIKEGTGYEVMKLTHSHPYITPYSKEVLEEIGIAFQTIMESDSYFTLTSVTRTPEQQKSLRRRNSNATNGNSSHSYGASFDISYIRFNGRKSWSRKSQKKLEKVLEEFEKAGKIFFIKERKQRCYHVTVR